MNIPLSRAIRTVVCAKVFFISFMFITSKKDFWNTKLRAKSSNLIFFLARGLKNILRQQSHTSYYGLVREPQVEKQQ